MSIECTAYCPREGWTLAADLFDEIDVDNFAGGGGVGMGFEMAMGKAFDHAINHDPASIAMHKVNHPGTTHHCESVWDIDPVEMCGDRPVRLAWFSPDCKHFSRAKGSKPVEKKIRGLAWVSVRWAKRVRPRVIMLENVREFQDWGPLTAENMPDPTRKGQTFKRFVSTLVNLGYEVQWRVLDAADYGAPTHRRRLFLIARSDGLPIVWPERTHGKGLKPYRTAAQCIDWSIPCPSIFERKRPLADKTLRRIALGIIRFVVNNPKPFIMPINHGDGWKNGGVRVRDIDRPSPTITGSRGEYLCVPSLAQVGYGERDGQAASVMDPQKPLGTVVASGKHALVSAMLSQYWGGMIGKPVTVPLPTTTGKGPHEALVSASLTRIGQYGSNGANSAAVDAPLSTIVSKAEHCVVAATLTKFRGDSDGQKIDQPCPTITSGCGAKRPAGAAHALAVTAATLTQFRGSNAGNGGDLKQPSPAITAGGRHIGLVAAFLAKWYGNDSHGQSVKSPVHTVTTKHRFALVTVKLDNGEDGVLVKVPGHGDFVIADIGLRMLTPRELARCQGFPDSYVLTGNQSNQVARIGNSVPPPVVEALVRANLGQPSRVARRVRKAVAI